VPDLVVILALTVGCVLLVGALGLAVGQLLHRHALRWQLAVVALVPVTAVATAVAVNAHFMFLSPHDSGVVAVALATGLVLGLVLAGLLVRRLVRGSNQLGFGIHRLVDGSAPPAAEESVTPALPLELEQVRRELAEARTTLAQARARERNAERARRELVSFLSHDLRTPLAGLRALTEGLEDGIIADVPRALGQLRATVARMTGLVEDLFDLSRSESPAQRTDRRLVSVSELVDDVADEQARAAEAVGVRLEVRTPGTDRLAISGDPDALARALANLLANAVRHTSPPGTVEVAADRAEDGRVRVSVRDSCGGIPEAHLDRVFDTGWRGSSARTTSDEPVGAGLGLAITQRVVTAHEGSIGVRNEGAGCCFEVQLPAGEAGAERPDPRP